MYTLHYPHMNRYAYDKKNLFYSEEGQGYTSYK